jgi:hypothetical protein
MKFPVNSLLAGNLAFSETSSQLTPPSSSESANFQYLSVGVISQRGRHDGSRRRSSRLPVSAARTARLHEIGEFLREVA